MPWAARPRSRLVSSPMPGAVPWLAQPPEPPAAVNVRPNRARIWSLPLGAEIIRRHGEGTLDYFALRDDKQHFFVGESFVAYRVFGASAWSLPTRSDPGLSASRSVVVPSLRAPRTDGPSSLLGASAAWLPVYAEGYMRSLYIGDEAIVDATDFRLAGGRRKSLRQAYNRIERNGYTATFHDPAAIGRPPRTRSSQSWSEAGSERTNGDSR